MPAGSMKGRTGITMIGIGGLYNYGCEAIVRGTHRIIREVLPGIPVVYPSLRYAEDRGVLADTDIEVVDARPRDMKSRMMRRMSHILQKRNLVRPTGPWNPRLQSLTECVLSIGGDIYTIDANTREENYFQPLVEFGEVIMAKGHSYVLWGCSVGPFDRHPEIEKYYAGHLKRCRMLVVREEVSAEYLADLGCRHIVQVADPAFLMNAASVDDGCIPEGRPSIGVNLSELSIRQRFPTPEWESRRRALVDEMRLLLEIENASILLIPHVQPQNGTEDDDVTFLTWLRGELRSERVHLLPEGLGAPATKGAIARCDVLVAARMHCAIAGVSSGVPTVFLSYSAKARGMARYVYGNSENCVDLAELGTGMLLSHVRSVLQDHRQIHASLRAGLPCWQEDARKAGASLLEIVSVPACS